MSVGRHLTVGALAFFVCAGAVRAENMPDASAERRVKANPESVVQVKVSVDKPEPNLGEVVNYTITLKNTSAQDIHDILVVTDRMPQEKEVVYPDNAHCTFKTAGSTPVIVCLRDEQKLFSLKKRGTDGDEITFTYGVRIDENMPCRKESNTRLLRVGQERITGPSKQRVVMAKVEVPSVVPQCDKVQVTYVLQGTDEPMMGSKVEYLVSMKNTTKVKLENIAARMWRIGVETSSFSADGAYCSWENAEEMMNCLQAEGKGFSLQPGQTRTFSYTAVLRPQADDPGYCNHYFYKSLNIVKLPDTSLSQTTPGDATELASSESIKLTMRCESSSSSSEPAEPPVFVTKLLANNSVMDGTNTFHPKALTTRNGDDHNVLKLDFQSPDEKKDTKEQFTAVIELPAGWYLQEPDTRWKCVVSETGASVCRSNRRTYDSVYGFGTWDWVNVRLKRDSALPACSTTYAFSYRIEGDSSRRASNTASAQIQVTCGYVCSDGQDNDKDGAADAADDGCRGKDGKYDPQGTTEVRKEEPCEPLFPTDKNDKWNDAYNVVFVANAEPKYARKQAQNWVTELKKYTPFKENPTKLQYWFVTPKKLSESELDDSSSACKCEAAYSCPDLVFPKNQLGSRPKTKQTITYMCATSCRANANANAETIRMPAGEGNDRVFAHELAHAFGNLSDEYTEFLKGSHPKSNCAPSEEIALKTWSRWVDVKKPDIHHGCAYVDTNVRWSENTMMRHHYQAESPDGFGPVNIGFLRQKLGAYSGKPKTMWQRMNMSLLGQLLSDEEGETALRLTLERDAAGKYAVKHSEVFTAPFGVKPAFEEGQTVAVRVGGKSFTQTFANESAVIAEDFDDTGIRLGSYEVSSLNEVTVEVGLGGTLQKDGVLIGPDLFPLTPSILVSACADFDEDPNNDCPEPMLHGAPLEQAEASGSVPDWQSWIFVIGSVASLGIVHWLLKHFVRHGQRSKII